MSDPSVELCRKNGWRVGEWWLLGLFGGRGSDVE